MVLLSGPRQCGKTTLARELLSEDSVNYFDLEDPASLARLDEPMTALRPLKGLVVVDEVQRRPDLFPVLRVLADRKGTPARFLMLGSASGDLLRQSGKPGRANGVCDHRGIYIIRAERISRAPAVTTGRLSPFLSGQN